MNRLGLFQGTSRSTHCCYFIYICNRSVTDLHGYVRGILDVVGSTFNLIPIAQVLKMPEESLDQVKNKWKDDDQQLEVILQHWLKDKNVVDDHAALRKDLESLKLEGTSRQDFFLLRKGVIGLVIGRCFLLSPGCSFCIVLLDMPLYSTTNLHYDVSTICLWTTQRILRDGQSFKIGRIIETLNKQVHTKTSEYCKVISRL